MNDVMRPTQPWLDHHRLVASIGRAVLGHEQHLGAMLRSGAQAYLDHNRLTGAPAVALVVTTLVGLARDIAEAQSPGRGYEVLEAAIDDLRRRR